jgi:CheY-like chemotaxis protein
VLTGAGIRVTEAAGPDEAIALARRVRLRAIVIDLRSASPGVLGVLDSLANDDQAGATPVLVVVPAVLSPRQQRALLMGAVAWCGGAAVPVTQVAEGVAEIVGEWAREPATAGGGRWPER